MSNLQRLTREQITFEFKIHGQGNLYGDGFAMWLTKQRAQPGNVFGHTDKFEGLGLFFDTYKNNRPGTVFPYIMAMNGDGNTPYDKDNDGKATDMTRPVEFAMPRSRPKPVSRTSKNNSSVSSSNTSQKANGLNASRSPTSRSHPLPT